MHAAADPFVCVGLSVRKGSCVSGGRFVVVFISDGAVRHQGACGVQRAPSAPELSALNECRR